MVSILDSWVFSQFISICHSKSHNLSQVVHCQLLLNIEICYIYLIAFTLSRLWTWNHMQTDTTYNLQTDWHTDSNSLTSQISTIRLAIDRLPSHRLANPRLAFKNFSNLGCVCPPWYENCCLVHVDPIRTDTVQFVLLAKCHFVRFFQQEINE